MFTMSEGVSMSLPYAAALAMCALSLAATPALADLSISNKPTSNMSCVGGVCTATAQKAVLNVTDLQNLLASGDVTVKTGNIAKDINIDRQLTWTSTSRLTLDPSRSIVVQQPVSITGTGALTLTTSDGGNGGDLWFQKKGHFEFWDRNSNLIINGRSYTLVESVNQLAKLASKQPTGSFALMKNYDAAKDGTYAQPPIITPFSGSFEGLGNSISNLAIKMNAQSVSAGLFSELDTGGVIRDVILAHATIKTSGTDRRIDYAPI
jgi:hypothetical protein